MDKSDWFTVLGIVVPVVVALIAGHFQVKSHPAEPGPIIRPNVAPPRVSNVRMDRGAGPAHHPEQPVGPIGTAPSVQPILRTPTAAPPPSAMPETIARGNPPTGGGTQFDRTLPLRPPDRHYDGLTGDKLKAELIADVERHGKPGDTLHFKSGDNKAAS